MAPGNPVGNRITNEIMYMANVLGQGRIPYIAPNSTLRPKPRQTPFTSLSSDQLPAGAYMTEAGRTYGIDSEQVGRLGGYMDERGRVFLPSNNQVNPSSWGAPSPGRTQPPAPGLLPPGGAQPPALSAADRAYEAEKSRVAQLTAQDPELQRYEKTRAAAKTQEEMNAARDIGMQIWQQKYGNTPMGQPGGAVGMRNPLMDRTFGYQSGSAPDQQMGAPTLGPSPLVPQVDQSLNPASPNFIGGEGAPIMNFADPRFENMSPEEFQKLLNQVNKK